jgi:hypothetical protein
VVEAGNKAGKEQKIKMRKDKMKTKNEVKFEVFFAQRKKVTVFLSFLKEGNFEEAFCLSSLGKKNLHLFKQQKKKQNKNYIQTKFGHRILSLFLPVPDRRVGSSASSLASSVIFRNDCRPSSKRK